MPSSCTLCTQDQADVLFHKSEREFLRCRGCGLVRVHPMPTEDTLSRYYQGAYRDGSYAAFSQAADIRQIIAAHRLDVVLPSAREGRWLDLGCSGGELVAQLAARGVQAEGVDASSVAVEGARARGLDVHCARVEEFEPSTRYATITAFDLIEHLLDPCGFVSRISGWLEPGGILVLTFPNAASIYARLLMRRHWFYYFPDEHLFYFDEDTIGRLLRRNGLAILHVARARKPLTPRYAADALALFNPTLGRLAGSAVSLLPRGLASRPWKIYLGELLVVAERVDPAEAPPGAAPP